MQRLGAASAAPAPFKAMPVFERAFVTVIADAIVRLRANRPDDQVAAFMDTQVRTLLRARRGDVIDRAWAAVWADELARAPQPPAVSEGASWST